MGFTRYWSIKKEIPQDKFDTFITFAEKIIKHNTNNGIKLGNGYGENDPNIDTQHIVLNGVGDGTHEGFILSRTPSICEWDRSNDGNEFCKTNGKPYDKVVYELLYTARYIFGDELFEYSGDCEESDNDDSYVKTLFRNDKIDKIIQ